MLLNHYARDYYTRNSLWVVIFLCSFGLLLTACGDNSTGVNGGGNGGGGNGNGNGNGNGGNQIGMEPTFQNVQAIFNQSCGGSSCHIGGRNSGVRLDSYENVIQSEGQQYGELIVQPDDPAGSPIIDKLQANPTLGSRMPNGGPYLSSDRIEQIQTWISNGAQNN
ncbi:MAG: hypothetical protein U5K69_20760 [Balneolaceae bacterium]|nr:hypothetical protein [Balneolaceae bacterium]